MSRLLTAADLLDKIPNESERLETRLHVLYDQRLDVEQEATSIAARRERIENDAAENAARRERIETEIVVLLAEQRAHYDSLRNPDDGPGNDGGDIATDDDDDAD